MVQTNLSRPTFNSGTARAVPTEIDSNAYATHCVTRSDADDVT